MEILPMFPIIIIVTLARCNSEPISRYSYINGNGYVNGNSPSQFGDLLKPPPPSLPIAPVPFYGGKAQRQIKDLGYHYQATSSPAAPSVPPPSDFKFPAPFYKQYNFNFVPPPQPFTTTPSPTFFQKISGWIFPSQQSAASAHNLNIESIKKDCNPCNQVPWIPVIKYNLGDKSIRQSHSPTYGPPSPTALAQNVAQYRPQPFNIPSHNQKPNHVSFTTPNIHQSVQDQSKFSGSAFGNPSVTYGTPSVRQQISFASQNPSSSVYSLPSPSYGFPQLSVQQSTLSLSGHVPPSEVFSSTYKPTSYITPVHSLEAVSQATTISPVKHHTYFPNLQQNQSPIENDFEILKAISPPDNQELPKVSYSTGFKNSYGEDISNSNGLDVSYSFTSMGAESSKIKTRVAPDNILKSFEPNISVALANPAPFTLNKGRNIHTLQPVALPNLSVSPLPPIFNARPFRPIISTTLPSAILNGLNYLKKSPNSVIVTQSVPITEFVHSIEYPTTIIESPVIDIDATKSSDQNKAYRTIPNSYVIDEARDISPQASEDHISSAKVNNDFSFETTGAEVGNTLFDNNFPTDMRQDSYVPTNHKPEFADLRGIKDVDVDRYRTESNLQSIDSPLLYLKPSAPHKNFENFLHPVSTPLTTSTSQNEYEIYDDVSTTPAPTQYTTSSDDDINTNHRDLLSSQDGRQNKAKIVQIIVPYITEQGQRNNNKELSPITQTHQHSSTDDDFLGRKVPSFTEAAIQNTVTETSTVPNTTIEQSSTVTEYYDSELKNIPTASNDFYDVKEPPFDIIKLQHTIDDWTEQEYSNHYATPDRTRSNEKYAKQIPDEYFTTVNPNDLQDHTTIDYNYDDYDHEGSSSVQHSITETRNSTFSKLTKEYNVIDKTKNKFLSEKGETDSDDVQKLRIYTAASSFRGTTATPAPWGSIQTSISPLTKEKVYVVTSKPWRDKSDTTKETNQESDRLESKKVGDDKIITDDFLFKSPRFSNRPPFGFTASGPMSLDSIKSDSSYGFSRGWHQSINNLRSLYQSESMHSSEGDDSA
ncbi:uncharacterized protein [Battus philenor]|uniref:uncharacterized protein n=1 Tax=Battus philenor TaxID=42288 RepID=UPI0035D0E076